MLDSCSTPWKQRLSALSEVQHILSLESEYFRLSLFCSHQMDCVKECREDEFLCKNHAHCIPKRWRCDDVFDCVDHSDEETCGHGMKMSIFMVKL